MQSFEIDDHGSVMSV